MTNYLNRVVDLNKLDTEIDKIRAKRDQLKKEQGRLRVQEHRLRKLRDVVIGEQAEFELP